MSSPTQILPSNVVSSKDNNLFSLVHSAIKQPFSQNFTISIRRTSTSSTRFSDASKSDDVSDANGLMLTFYSLFQTHFIRQFSAQKSSIPSKKIESPATAKTATKPGSVETNTDVNSVLTASPLEVKTKAGKLTVSAIEALKASQDAISGGGADDEAKKQQVLEIATKKGKLFVIATEKDNKLADIVLAKEKTGANDASTVVGNGGTATKPAVKPRRERVDFSRSSLERNFITPARAMSDFLLKLADLESLPKTKRRSPYEQEPPIIVYWRKDVEAKAIEVWGSRENLLRECLKREIEKKRHQQSECCLSS